MAQRGNGTKCDTFISSASASDATFFVTTGVLTMLYAILIIAVYAKFDDKYKSDYRLPLFVSKNSLELEKISGMQFLGFFNDCVVCCFMVI